MLDNEACKQKETTVELTIENTSDRTFLLRWAVMAGKVTLVRHIPSMLYFRVDVADPC